MINGIGPKLARRLLNEVGDAESIFSEKQSMLERVPGIGRTLAAEIKNAEVLKRAEREAAFAGKNNISCRFITDDDYPFRLRQCEDAPVILYSRGECDLNALRIISIVGTRRPTDYGRSLTGKLVAELAAVYPDMVIVSGLAYGIDITAHRNAIKNQLPTVAVLAHGLDRVYPFEHSSTASEMLEYGGACVTEFPSGTNPDKINFVRRNRIIAGLSDATVVVESSERGGSLITAEMAFSYDREVFAFPGRATDIHSHGCNRIISQDQAALIMCANDLILAMRWDTGVTLQKESQPVTQSKPRKPVQTELVFTVEDDPFHILSLLQKNGSMHINQISAEVNIPVSKLSGMLLDMEMDKKLQAVPGSAYKLV
jgi:DNA processing protein